MKARPTERGARGRAAGASPPAAQLRVDPANAQAWYGEQPLKLTPKALAVLHYLLEHPGQLVTKEELMQRVWAETVVTDGALVACLREIRRAIGDDARHPQYIETVHRRGYRLMTRLGVAPRPFPEQRPRLNLRTLSTQHSRLRTLSWSGETQSLHSYTPD